TARQCPRTCSSPSCSVTRKDRSPVRSRGASASSKRPMAARCCSTKFRKWMCGGTRPVPVDIRIIATSNRNLTEAVREGKFREDLLFRLNVVNLKIPALRERPADIIELAQYFAKKYAEANGVPLRPLSAEARHALTVNRWPGNVRELENTLHRAVLLSGGDEIGVDAILTPEGTRLDQARTPAAVQHAALAAEQVT